MLADQTVLRRAVAVRRQMVANRCRTCCDVSRWGAPAMLQHTNCAGHPSMCISETTRSSSVLSARHANTMDSSRDRVSTGRGERGVFESATVGMVEGMEISVVRAVCAVSTVPAVSADSSAASGPSTPAGLSRSSTLSPSKATSQAISKSSISPQLAPDSGRTEADIILTSLVLPGSTVTVTSIGMHSAFGRSTTARPACRLTPVGQHDETEHEGHRQHMAFEVVRR